MAGNLVLSKLVERLEKKKMGEEEKLCLGTVILTEGILIATNPSEKISISRLAHAADFDLYTAQPWGKIAYDVLATSVKRLNEATWGKGQYEVKGFVMAIHLWALKAVPMLGQVFATKCNATTASFPWGLEWETTRTPRINQILNIEKMDDVSVYNYKFTPERNFYYKNVSEFFLKNLQVVLTTVVGDPEEYKHLVPETHYEDTDFLAVVQLVEQGYKLKSTDWIQGFVDLYAAMQDIGINHGKKKMSDSQKLDKILKLLESFNKRITVIEEVLTIRLDKEDNDTAKEVIYLIFL